MGLSKPGVSVDKKWIVNLARGLAHCMSGGSSELVRFPDDEKVKGVTLAERRGAGAVLCQHRLCNSDRWSDEKIHLRPLFPLLVDPEYHIHRVSKDDWTEARQ